MPAPASGTSARTPRAVQRWLASGLPVPGVDGRRRGRRRTVPGTRDPRDHHQLAGPGPLPAHGGQPAPTVAAWPLHGSWADIFTSPASPGGLRPAWPLWLSCCMPFRRPVPDLQTLSAAAMSALLLTSAAKHFREPEFFHPVVPDFLCRDDSGEQPNGPLAVLSREEWVAVSGLLEAAAAVGLLVPATRQGRRGLRHGACSPLSSPATWTPCAKPTGRRARRAGDACTPCGSRSRRPSSHGPGL